MATCSASTLLQSNACLCEVTVSPLRIARLNLLCQIYSALTMASCDVGTLMDRAKCFCSITQNNAERLELQLLCEISNALGSGGGGGGGAVPSGPSDPVTPPTGPFIFYYNTTTQTFWAYNSASGAWEKLIG